MNFKVVFNLDGCGIYYDMNDPIHLDGLLAYALSDNVKSICQMKDDKPDDILLPLKRSEINGIFVWHASSLFCEKEKYETLRFWRKKFRQNRIEKTSGSPNLTSGVYREYNMPVPLLLIPRLIAYASGDIERCRYLLKKIKGLGKKRAYGYGKIVSIDFEETMEDWSIIYNGVAMRWIPDAGGSRFVRCSPPYWNSNNRVYCKDVGENYNYEKITM